MEIEINEKNFVSVFGKDSVWYFGCYADGMFTYHLPRPNSRVSMDFFINDGSMLVNNMKLDWLLESIDFDKYFSVKSFNEEGICDE